MFKRTGTVRRGGHEPPTLDAQSSRRHTVTTGPAVRTARHDARTPWPVHMTEDDEVADARNSAKSGKNPGKNVPQSEAAVQFLRCVTLAKGDPPKTTGVNPAEMQ